MKLRSEPLLTVAFVWGELTLEGPAEVAIGADGGSATLTVTGQADGADVMITSGQRCCDCGWLYGIGGVAASAMLTASVGDVMSNSVEVKFVPSLVRYDRGDDSSRWSGDGDGNGLWFFRRCQCSLLLLTAGTDAQSSDDGSTLTLTKSTPGDVMAHATDGTIETAKVTISFVPTPPELVSDAADGGYGYYSSRWQCYGGYYGVGFW